MGGGYSEKFQEQLSRLQMDPEIQRRYMESVFGLQPQVAAFQQQAADAASQLQTGPLSTQPSALTRGIISSGRQSMLDQFGAQSRALSGLDPRTAQLMRGQLAAKTVLGANPLTLQAMENQRTRDLAEMQARNQAIIQRSGLEAAPMQAQQNLIQQLGQAGQLTGLTRQFQREGEMKGGQGTIQGNLANYGLQANPGPLLFPGASGTKGNLRGPSQGQTYKA